MTSDFIKDHIINVILKFQNIFFNPNLRSYGKLLSLFYDEFNFIKNSESTTL